MKIEQCRTCYFYEASTVCLRFPTYVQRSPIDWCGEWRLVESKTCGAKWVQALLTDVESAAPGIAGRLVKEIIHTCRRGKDHEGVHSDGFTDWEVRP